jgi:cation-transporting ATPase I
MNGVSDAAPRILHALPGRLRVHLPQGTQTNPRGLERRLKQTPGVRRVECNPITGNVLIRFDERTTNADAVLTALRSARRQVAGDSEEETPPPPVLHEKGPAGRRRARIAVRGLDRDPEVGRRLMERLGRYQGVQAHSSSLTGRLLVEYDEHETDLTDLLSEVSDIELPDLPNEDRPAHPLDPGPLIQSAARTAGAALGLGMLVTRRLAGLTGPPRGARTAATLSGIIGLLRAFPVLRDGLRRLLGRDAADLIFSTANIATLAFANSPLGLAVTGLEAVILLREVMARRSAFRRYEERVTHTAIEPGAVVRIEAGERTPRAAEVLEGNGTAIGRNGLPMPVHPGALVPAGARLNGGPFVLRLRGGRAFVPHPRPVPLRPTFYQHYLRAVGPASLAYAALTALRTWSLGRTFEALLLVNPRTAVIGMEASNLDAASHVLRSGVTIVGTRPERYIRLPNVLLLDGPRVLCDGFEIASVLSLGDEQEGAALLALASGVSAAAGAPWGNAFPRNGQAATDGEFDGTRATARIDGVAYSLAFRDEPPLREARDSLRQGVVWLVLHREDPAKPLAAFALRPRLSERVAHLVAVCRRHGVRLELAAGGDAETAQAVAGRAGIPLTAETSAMASLRAAQRKRQFVAFVSDHADAAPAFAACDLAIGLSSGRSGRFSARVDLLAPDLTALAAIVEAGAYRQRAVRDSVLFSTTANVVGGVWGLRGRPGIQRASLAIYITALAALADGIFRLRGGERPRSALAYLIDPHPERWGRRSPQSVLKSFKTSLEGLSAADAARRRRSTTQTAPQREFLSALLDQLRSPVNGILAGGAFLALLAGKALDIVVIGVTVGANVAIGTWQERQASQAAEALKRLGTVTARVRRDGRETVVPSTEIVPGDLLVLASGDRVAADARLMEARHLEVDEAALTGESVPVLKQVEDGAAENQIVLEGSDVVVGNGVAVVVAVGRHTRMGATASALTLDEIRQSPLGQRLARILARALPLAVGGGALVVGAGLLWGHGLLPQLTAGVSIALAVVPESLPLLAGSGQVGVARRLAKRGALLQRLSAVESLGRVDVVCTDKTGTLTVGRLTLCLIDDGEREAALPGELPPELRSILLSAALASPSPDAPDASAHPTDLAVLRAAEEAGLGDETRQRRDAVAPFDPARSFHAARVAGRLHVKGAPEAVLDRCTHMRRQGATHALDEETYTTWTNRARELAGRGLRVLLIAEGTGDQPPEDPSDLTVLGFVGITDPLRPGVAESVRRCRDAGVRVVMITGDHPDTARAIARDAGLPHEESDLLNGAELVELHNGALDRRLQQASVVARATPLDKLRIVEGLRRLGHVVAMTGDGVNDAPALRLADVGVAMGRGGTAVARQAADLVLADDNFATLVEAFVEGRGFWRNMRRSLSLLLGGNLGELGLLAGASVLGHAPPLNTAQILVVNLITDALPALAVVLQKPEHRHLTDLAREGTAALDAALRGAVARRGLATAAPALTTYLLSRRTQGIPTAQAVAYGGIIANQLAQTLDAGWIEGRLSPSVLGAVAASAGLLASSLTFRPLRDMLGLSGLGLGGLAFVGSGAAAAVLLNRVLAGESVSLSPNAGAETP